MKYLLILMVLWGNVCEGQVITTYAGGGTNTSDNIPATNARLQIMAGSNFDKNGNFYFAEHGDSKIKKINIYGIISTIAGTGVAGYKGDSILATTALLHDA